MKTISPISRICLWNTSLISPISASNFSSNSAISRSNTRISLSTKRAISLTSQHQNVCLLRNSSAYVRSSFWDNTHARRSL
jgi:hypothetical protein